MATTKTKHVAATAETPVERIQMYLDAFHRSYCGGGNSITSVREYEYETPGRWSGNRTVTRYELTASDIEALIALVTERTDR